MVAAGQHHYNFLPEERLFYVLVSTITLTNSFLPFRSFNHRLKRHLHRAALVIELAIHITDLAVQVTEVTISLASRSLRSPKVSPWLDDAIQWFSHPLAATQI